MPYVPRNRSRVPLMKRLKETMNTVLDEASVAQEQAAPYSPSNELDNLFDSVKDLQEEEKLLESHQKDTLHFAQKFAQFVKKLHGVRLRTVSSKEYNEMTKRKHDAIRARKGVPAILKKNGVRQAAPMAAPLPPPPVHQPSASDYSSGYGSLLFSEPSDMTLPKEEDFVKEEPLCEVDDTPLSYLDVNNAPAMAPILKDEIKEEEPDEPSSSSSHFDDISHQSQQPQQKKPARLRVSDGMNFRVVELDESSRSALAAEDVATRRDRPSLKRRGVPMHQAATRLLRPGDPRLSAFRSAQMASTEFSQSRAFGASSAKIGRRTISNGTPVPRLTEAPILNDMGRAIPSTRPIVAVAGHRVIARTPVYDIIEEKVSRDPRSLSREERSNYNFGRRVMKCDVCSQSIEERLIGKHMKAEHPEYTLNREAALTESQKFSVKCTEIACDFACGSQEEKLNHCRNIHREPYKSWLSKGRFKVATGSRCPHCSHSVSDTVELCQHLHRQHPLKMYYSVNVYSCSSCNKLFSKLFQVYEHWHKSGCSGNMKIHSVGAGSTPAKMPPRAVVEKDDPITVPRGPKTSQQVKLKITENVS